jgi:GNAT superfamily N-acetyltransferase
VVSPEITVRLATAEDAEVAIELVGRLLVELGGVAPAHDAVRPTYDRLVGSTGTGFVVLGSVDGSTAAVCTVSYLEALRTEGPYAIVQEMYVEPDARSSGVGAELLRFVLDEARSTGCDTVELGTPMDGDRQVQFYERLGFRRVGERLRWTAP